MRTSSKAWRGLFVLIVAAVLPHPASGQAQADSLRLLAPNNVRVFTKMNDDRKSFTNFAFWEDIPKDVSTLVHDVDTTGWHTKFSTVPSDSLSVPQSGGVYTGNIDRTLTFLAPRGGRVGVGGNGTTSVVLRYNVDGGRENRGGEIDVGRGYRPGTPVRCLLRPENLDLGFTVSFSAGVVDSNATFRLGLEDFEGYHVFRGLRSDGSDLINIGEVSKEEAFRGEDFDSLYFTEMLDSLRSTGVYRLPAPVPGIGDAIDIRNVHPMGKLGANELFWVDRNGFSGFTYYYVITSFDKGYNVSSASQGLTKFDHCPVTEGATYPCPSEIVSLSTELEPQNDLTQIYAVPNPYRSGTSQFTTENYHNFPDNMLRFFNVPAWCIIKIYTPSGDLVWEYSQVDGSGNVAWDTRNQYEEEVASGVYIYRVESEDGDWMYGRIIIIR